MKLRENRSCIFTNMFLMEYSSVIPKTVLSGVPIQLETLHLAFHTIPSIMETNFLTFNLSENISVLPFFLVICSSGVREK